MTLEAVCSVYEEGALLGIGLSSKQLTNKVFGLFCSDATLGRTLSKLLLWMESAVELFSACLLKTAWIGSKQ